MATESPFDVVGTAGPAWIFRDGPKPRASGEQHGCVEVDGGERVAVFVRAGRFWPVDRVVSDGRALVKLAAHPNIARTRFFDLVRAQNKYFHVVDRPGGVALPALVRRVRKRAGTLPPAFCIRLARDLALVHAALAKAGVAVVATISDAVLTWDGAVIVTPRIIGAAGDVPIWARPMNDPPAIIASLLAALFAPELAAGSDVDKALHTYLTRRPLTLETVPPELRELVHSGVMRQQPTTGSGRRRAVEARSVTHLDKLVTELGGDDPGFAAALIAELFPGRRRADLAWREEMAACALPSLTSTS